VKNIPTPLLEYLLSTDVESGYVCDLFSITLKSGQQLYATDGQINITYGGNVYQATTYGAWKITKVRTALGMTQSSMDFTLQAGVDTIIQPFNIPILEAVQLGLFDAATVTVYRTYSEVYGDTSLGVEVKFGGQITEFTKNGRTLAEGTVEGYSFALNQQMPRQTLQPGCRWTLYDVNTCTTNKASFTYTNAVATGTTNITITPASAISLPAGILLDQGTVTFTSGQNSGLSMSIQTYDGTIIRLTRPMLFPMAVGDTFSMSAGCAHTFAACQAFQGSNAYTNFGGTPFVPSMESAL